MRIRSGLHGRLTETDGVRDCTGRLCAGVLRVRVDAEVGEQSGL
ncbi:hypothetical protein [Sodalis ligni]|nr:hypothetical protein [Sodalis ligni]